jgi:hypothetical protein
MIGNNPNVVMIKNKNNIIEKYYLDTDKQTIFKLSNIKYFSKFYILKDYLYINNVINGYEKYIKLFENNDYIYTLTDS